MEYKITFERDPAAAEIQILSAGINEFTKNKLGFTRSQNGDGKNTPLAFFLRGAAGEVVGGVYGNYSAFGWLYVSTLWVSDLVRGGGYGTRDRTGSDRKRLRECVSRHVQFSGGRIL